MYCQHRPFRDRFLPEDRLNHIQFDFLQIGIYTGISEDRVQKYSISIKKDLKDTGSPNEERLPESEGC